MRTPSTIAFLLLLLTIGVASTADARGKNK